MTDHLGARYPRLGSRLPKAPLADLPTPVGTKRLSIGTRRRDVSIKYDDLTAGLYGGNKVRKLEYLLRRALDRGAARVATFGTVASNHALATTLYAGRVGLPCTCLLSHQTRTPACGEKLGLHLAHGTELVYFGGPRAARVNVMRERLQGRHTWAIPAGGSSWLGAVGFVNAGLELAEQVNAGEIDAPDRVYVANGTMATAAGLALGLALAGLGAEVQAVRVTHVAVSNPDAMRRLVAKTALLLRRLDPAIPADLGDRIRLRFRDEFFGGGYAHTTPATDRAVALARDELGLELESTYTGKALAALLDDLDRPALAKQSMLFWNTFNSRPVGEGVTGAAARARLPVEFLRYFD
jgi:1-aminocyclopropane-1-carboxylate deaminase/D-cysteine desulfhydrase-like pyridoxal-dependent ACC family enzyme